MKKLIIHDEECRAINGFSMYCISESGQIYRTHPINSLEQRILDNGSPYVRKCKWHYRNKWKKIGQPFFSLKNDEKNLRFRAIAPYVAEAFDIGGGIFDHEKHSIEFIDGNCWNVHYTNLRLIPKLGPNGKLNKYDIKEIKSLIRKGKPLNQIAAKFGVSDMQVNRIKTGENWGNGKRKIQAPVAPFPVKDGKIRRYIATFKAEPAKPGIRKPFAIKRNPNIPTDNTIIGILKGYKLTLKHQNITRAKVNVEKLNKYFFN